MENWYNHNRAGVSCRMRNQAGKTCIFFMIFSIFLIVNLCFLGFPLFIFLTETCSVEGSVRLSDGATAREGRVEVCRGGYWGSVCSIGWSRLNSLVACRSAGFETLRMLNNDFYHYLYCACRSHDNTVSIFRSRTRSS